MGKGIIVTLYMLTLSALPAMAINYLSPTPISKVGLVGFVDGPTLYEKELQLKQPEIETVEVVEVANPSKPVLAMKKELTRYCEKRELKEGRKFFLPSQGVVEICEWR